MARGHSSGVTDWMKQAICLAFVLCLTLGSHSGSAEPAAAPTAQAPLPAPVDLEHLTIEGEHALAPAGGLQATLTLDVGLQRQVLRLLRAALPVQGAAVVLDVETGRVLVWADTSKRGQESLLYRASAPAASVFKLVTTVALFERGGINPRQTVCIHGGEHGIYRRHLDEAKGPHALCAPFFQALGHSRNAVYAQLANHYLMRDDLLEVAEKLGFNHSLPFDVDVELGRLKVPYNNLEFARTAAGFTHSRLTPLGAAYLSFLVANRGRAARLSIVESLGDYHAPEHKQDLGRVLSANTAWRMVRMMEVTVRGGTSLAAFSDDRGRSYLGSLRAAGKTGTLQLTPDSPTTSWFTGFAPSRKPKVVVTVLLQNGKVWHRKANEVARDVLRQYFADRGVRGITAP